MSLSHIFGLVILASLTVNAILNEYGNYQLKSKGKIPTIVSVTLASVPNVLACSVKCLQDNLCLSFYYGISKCGIFHSGKLNLKESSGYDYYEMNEAATTTVVMQETSPIPLATTTPPQVCSVCPYGSQQRFYIYGKSAFVICLNQIMWKTASDACTCVGARLVNIANAETQKYVEDMSSVAQQDSGTNFGSAWIGLSGKANGQGNPYSLSRSDGQTITRTSGHFTKWYPGEPDNNLEVGIGVILEKGNDFGLWIDTYKQSPSDMRKYICEFTD